MTPTNERLLITGGRPKSDRSIHFACVIAGLFVLVSTLGGNFLRNADRPMDKENVDEAHWIASGYYFHLLFTKFDVYSRDWKHYACIDQPPFAKYLFGMASNRAGFPVTSLDLEQKHFLLGDVANQDRLLREFNREIPRNAFRAARFVSTLAFALSGILILHLGGRLFSPFAGFCAVTLFSNSPMVLRLSREVMAEGIQAFLVLGTVASQLAILDARRQARVVWPWLGTLSLTLALLFNTKVNGIIAWPLAMLGILLGGFAVVATDGTRRNPPQTSRIRRWSIGCLLALIAIAMAAFLAIAINPSLYDEPLKFVRGMFGLRVRMLEIQRHMVFPLDLPTWPLRAAAFSRALFLENDRFVPMPVLFFSFLAGIFRIRDAIRGDRLAWGIFGVNAVGWILAGFASYSIDVSRYLIVTVPFVCIVAGAGVGESLLLFRGIASVWWKRTAVGLLLAVLSFLLLVFVGRNTMEKFLVENPEWRADAEMRSAAALQKDEEEAKEPRWFDMLDELVKDSPF